MISFSAEDFIMNMMICDDQIKELEDLAQIVSEYAARSFPLK